MTMRDSGQAALAFGSPASQPRHLGRQAAFVDEHQMRGFQLRLADAPSLAPGLHIGALLLGRVGGLFLCVMAWRSRNFQKFSIYRANCRVSGPGAASPNSGRFCRVAATRPLKGPSADRMSPMSGSCTAYLPTIILLQAGGPWLPPLYCITNYIHIGDVSVFKECIRCSPAKAYWKC